MNAEEINRFFNSFFNLDNEDNSYNPFLRISKATHSKMKSYNFSKFDRLIYRLGNVRKILPLVIIIRIIINSVFNLLRFAIYYKPKKKLKKADVLFLSHLTLRNLNSQEDSFYGSLPDVLKKSNKKISIIYSNQTRRLSRLKLKEIESTNNLVIPKYLEFKELIKYIFTATKSIQFSLNQVKKQSALNSHETLLVSKACLSFLKIETMMNFHLIEMAKKMIIDCQPRYVFITIEGHIYENSIYLYCKNNPLAHRIFMYQNSPIGPSQYGLFDFIKHNEEKLTYVVQGNAYKKLIIEKNSSSQVLVTGRIKEKLEINIGNRGIVDPKLLMVPDGDKLNVLCFLNLAKYFYDHVSSEIVISVHPDTHIGLYNKIKLFNLKRKGFIKKSVSNLSMEHIAKYDLLAYTSSSIAMRSLLLDISLIYVNNSKYNLDPLWLIKRKGTYLTEQKKVKLIIDKYATKEYNELCSELDYEQIVDLIM